MDGLVLAAANTMDFMAENSREDAVRINLSASSVSTYV